MYIFIAIVMYIVVGFWVMNFIGLSHHTIKMPAIVYYLLIAMFFVPCVIGGVILWFIQLFKNGHKTDDQSSTISTPSKAVETPDYFK
jgi:H+/Cl- antiporter ClcA